MSKFTENSMGFFTYLSHLAYLNLLWLLFSLLGLGFWGVAPATSSLINQLYQMREEKNYTGIKEFWSDYKVSFKKSNSYFITLCLFFFIILLNIRINNVLLNGSSILTTIYLSLGILVFFIGLILFYNSSKNTELTFKENVSISIVALTRSPHSVIAIFCTLFLFYLLISQKFILFFLGGLSLFLYITEFIHHQMIIKLGENKRE